MYITNPSWLGASEAIYQKQKDLLKVEDEALREKDRLMSVAREFEAIFYHQLFKSMRRTVPRSGLMDGGYAEDVFQDFLDYELARLGVEQSTGGLAQMIYDQYSSYLSKSHEEPKGEGEALPLP